MSNYIKKEENFDQFLNFSPSNSNLNTPITGNAPFSNSGDSNNTQQQQGSNNTSNFQQNGVYQSTPGTRPVPGFKSDYDLQKASSQTDLSIQVEQDEFNVSSNQQYDKKEVDLFLDELHSLNSPINALNNTIHYPDYQQYPNGSNLELNTSSPTYGNLVNSPNENLTPPPPPVIISTPPVEETSLQQIQPNFEHYDNQFYFDQADEFINQQHHHQQQQQNDETDFLNTNFHSNNNGSSFQQMQLHPSPSNGALSEISSVEGSPYLSAYSPSHFGDDLGDENDNNFLEFDTIGQNLNAINLSEVNSDISHGGTPDGFRLTEENLTAINNYRPVTISIDAAPEETHSQHTPSLFSSNRSSPNNSPHHSRANSNNSQNLKSGHYSDLLSPNNDNDSAIDDEELLKPDDHDHQQHANMRLGRQRRQSRSRSRSVSKTRENHHQQGERSLSNNREKMLELASSNQSNKRVQKHPSIYACHLCEKRFTRPYNLKSHLRTHTDERPFVCTICGKAFARQHDRKRHEDLHTGKKRYECKGVLRDGVTTWGCGKKFARTDALGRHFKTEAGKECIRPLLEEHENEAKQGGGGGDGESGGQRGDSLTIPRFKIDDQFPEELYNQFPNLLYGSQNNSGVSDLSDFE